MENQDTSYFGADENVIEFLRGDDRITVTLSDRHLINVVQRLAKKYSEIEILAQPRENGGYLYAHLPLEFLRLQAPPRTPTASAEQLEAARRNIQRARDVRESLPYGKDFDAKTASKVGEV